MSITKRCVPRRGRPSLPISASSSSDDLTSCLISFSVIWKTRRRKVPRIIAPLGATRDGPSSEVSAWQRPEEMVSATPAAASWPLDRRNFLALLIVAPQIGELLVERCALEQPDDRRRALLVGLELGHRAGHQLSDTYRRIGFQLGDDAEDVVAGRFRIGIQLAAFLFRLRHGRLLG